MTMPSGAISPAERMVSAMAREIDDGDVLLEGIGTFLPTVAYILAQLTQAPHALRLCPVGNAFVGEPHALSLAGYEFETLRRGVHWFTYLEVSAAYLPTFFPGRRTAWKEFLRPAQVDVTGRTNNVVIGEHARPRVRLPGAAGLPDAVPVETQVFMYVPRHNRQTFVERVDFVSAPGHREGARAYLIVTDLALLGFGADGAMEVQALFPGVERRTVEANTGFSLRFCEPLPVVPDPRPEELHLLRTVVDPHGLRDLEFSSGAERLDLLERAAGRDPAHSLLRERLEHLVAGAADRRA